MTSSTYVSFDAELLADEAAGEPPWGRAMATAIREGLRSRGVECGKLDETDYSFFFHCELGQESFRVEVGYVDDDDGRQWLAYVAPQKRGLFKKATADPSAITASLHDLLTTDLRVTPQWFTEAEWNDASFGRGRPTPA